MSEESTPEQNSLLKKIEFHPPIDNADPHYTYTDLLDSAMKDKDVTNIALAGPYGSGKSSILKTYFENRRKGTYNPIWISMAGFENADDTPDEIGTPPNGQSKISDQERNTIDIQRRIEQSILQQLFYSVEKKDIPLSKLRRIEKPDMDGAVRKSVWILVHLYTAIVSFKPSLLPFAIPPEPLIGLFQFFFLLMTIVAFPWVIGHLSGARLNKIIIKDTEFSFDDNEQNTSLINRHIDEIINYFEATGKDVLVIEDLDRFKLQSIFTKLRELNTLINQCASFREKNKKVVFIYAVKDDLFAGEERTKFFDAIIPVIPQVNASGMAIDFFTTRLGANIAKKLGIQFLTDISTYIHDFRLLANICNEFIVYVVEKEGNEKKIQKNSYKSILEDGIYLQKLFALIVYKNFFPEDFARLHQNRGWVYNVLNKNLTDAMKNHIEGIQAKILKLYENIEVIEETTPLELEEARLLAIVKHLTSLGHHNIATINNMSPAQMAKNEQNTNNFLQMTGQVPVYLSEGRIANITVKPCSQNILNLIKNTSDRLSDKTTAIQIDIALKNKQIRNIRGMSLANIAREFGESDLFADIDELYIDSTDPAKKLNKNEKIRRQPFEELVKYLLRQGLIANDYGEYISYFSGDGIMSSRDRDYRKRVNNNGIPLHNAIIDNPEAIYITVKPEFFSHPAAVNRQMCRFLFTATNMTDIDEARKYFMDAIQENPEFIINFLEGDSDVTLFIKQLAEDYKNFAWDIIANHEIENFRKQHIAYTFLANLSLLQISQLGTNFIKYIEKNMGLLSIYDMREEPIDITIFKSLNVSFLNMGKMLHDRSKKLLEYIYKENLYQLTAPMISEITLLNTEQPYTREHWDVDYSKIVNLDMKELIVRIDNEIEKYVNNIFIPVMEEHGNPFEGSIIMLLNHQRLSDATKETLISKLNIAINHIAQIENETQRMQTMKYGVARSTWENMLTYYDDVHCINENAISYISNPDYFSQLISSTQYPAQHFDDLIIHIALHPSMSNEHLKMLANVVKINSISLKGVNKSRIKDLVESGIITLNPENYQTVIENADDLNKSIGAELIVQNINTVLENIHGYTISEEQATIILDRLEDLSSKIKFASSEVCATVSTPELAGALGRMAMEIISKKQKYKFETNQLLSMFTTRNNDRVTKLHIAVDQLPYHVNGIVLTAIKGISSRYVAIAESTKRKPVSFPYSEIEECLLNFLSERKIIGTNVSRSSKGDIIHINTLQNPAGKVAEEK